MKPSIYNIYFDYKNKSYVFNTLSNAIIALDTEIVPLLKINNLSCMESNTITILQENGIIVEDDMNEVAVYENFYHGYRYKNVRQELRLVILPTYQCNLRCKYCFEDSHEIKDCLDEAKILSIIEFANNELNKIPHYDYKKINLVLFGGEPLVNREACIAIAEKLKVLADSNNLIFDAQIITNATLIDDDIIKRLIIPYKVNIQITFDGLKTIHDSRRIYKNGKGSFEKIKEAVCLINQYDCKDLLTIRLNVDKENESLISAFYDEFHSMCKHIYVGLLRAAGNNKNNLSKCISDQEYHTRIHPNLLPTICKYNIKHDTIAFGKRVPCAMNSEECYVIDPKLDVYKCDNLVGMKQHSVGYIDNKGVFHKNAQYYKQMTWSPFHFSQCTKCNLLPICSADCAYKCLLINGSMELPHCALTEKELIERIKTYLHEKELEQNVMTTGLIN